MVSKISLAFAIGLSSFQVASRSEPRNRQPESAAQTETAIEAKAGSATKDWMNWRGPAQNGSSTQTGTAARVERKATSVENRIAGNRMFDSDRG